MARYRKTLTVELNTSRMARALGQGATKVEVGMGTLSREVATKGTVGAKRRFARTALGRHVLPGIGVAAAQATIKLDRRRHPAIMGAEFGGRRRPTTQQFPPWRGSGRQAGYALYPALRDQEAMIERTVVRIIERGL